QGRGRARRRVPVRGIRSGAPIVPEVHKYIGFGVVTLFGLLWFWPATAWLLGKARRVHGEPGRWYWGLVAACQVILAIQIVIGVALLAIHGVHAKPVLHYLY